MARPEKVAVVEDIQERLSKAQGAVLTDYRGLTVSEVTELRKQLREAGVDFKVLKNTLSIRAVQNLEMNDLVPFLTGPTAFAFGYSDPVTPAKILSDFAKKNKALEIKGGIVEGTIVGPEEVSELAELPNRDELIAMVLRGMQAPVTGMVNVLQGNIRNVIYALEAIREQKEQASA